MLKKLPSRARDVATRYPKVFRAFEHLGAVASEAGPISGKERRLVKLALAIGRGAEGAVHSHVRQAVAEGVSAAKIRHVAMLGITTLGFPAAVSAMTWIEDVLGSKEVARGRAAQAAKRPAGKRAKAKLS